jgi:hypothetical protein
MTDCADLDFRKGARAVSGGRTERRMKMVRTLMMAAIAGTVVLALIAEARRRLSSAPCCSIHYRTPIRDVVPGRPKK